MPQMSINSSPHIGDDDYDDDNDDDQDHIFYQIDDQEKV